MMRYWYSLTPLVVVLTVFPLALPWLGLIALMLFALIALAALGTLAWGIVFVPHMVVRAVGRRRHSRRGTRRQPATLSAARPSVRPTQSMPASASLLLASPPSESERLT
jgi:membrane protein implicated in regulation of membrane protease activity